MNRLFVIVALTGFLLIFPALVKAQRPSQVNQSEQAEPFLAAKNVASLTTTDLLSSQDFAPQVTELASKRSRRVNPVKGSKGVGKTVNEVEEGLKTAKPLSSSSNVVSGVEVMRPAIEPVPTPQSNAGKVPLESVKRNVANQHLDDLITQSAARNGLDRDLILAVMKQESSFNPQAISYKGARGLMQLMPATAARFGVRDIFDPAQNIEGGARYLRFLLNTFNGDVELALAGYNAGENAVFRYGNQIPPYRETQDYVRKISAHYARLKNGNVMRRPAKASDSSDRKSETEIITVGTTMTQY
ncbi:MAG TPA: lytic transglycosylase domain-containing protein [Blastocatellia bacterium]|nr:lytic transglycosylase domain-containing protein [Blastocatellia bacterium]